MIYGVHYTIEDEEIIELQVNKLKQLSCDDNVKKILDQLEKNDYGNVTQSIEEYIEKYTGVVVYEDKELQGLRLELKVLEKKLQDLSAIKSEYLNDIDAFNIQYHLHLGDIIQKILKLREELLYASIREKEEIFENLKDETKILKSRIEELELELENTDEFDDAYDELYSQLEFLKDKLNSKEKELNQKRKETKEAKQEFEEDETTQEYKESKQDYEYFHNEYEEVLKEERYDLTDKEQKELKKLYRKAARLCHPDIVSTELKEQAQVIIQKLNDAYAKRDLQNVKEIFEALESGKSFDVASDTIEDKALLKSKIVDIRNTIDKTIQDLDEIKEDETFKIIQEHENIEEYFDEIKSELEAEYNRLSNSDQVAIDDTYEATPKTHAKQKSKVKKGECNKFCVNT